MSWQRCRNIKDCITSLFSASETYASRTMHMRDFQFFRLTAQEKTKNLMYVLFATRDDTFVRLVTWLELREEQ